MRHPSHTARVLVISAGALIPSVAGSVAQAALFVDQGFDLWITDSMCFVPDPPLPQVQIPFEGVPLGTFDFGSGPVGVGPDVDTIVERLDQATVPSAPATANTIDIELVALQLVSIAPIDLGFGPELLFATLDPTTPSLGSMDITFDDANGGTWDSSLTINYLLHGGALNGPVRLAGQKVLAAVGEDWKHNPGSPPLNVPEINGVNHLLNGVDVSHDFHSLSAYHENPDGTYHEVSSPAPSTVVLFALSGACAARRRRP